MNQPIESFNSTISSFDAEELGRQERQQASDSVLAARPRPSAAAGGGYWAYWKQVGSRYVSTDNAYTAAEVAMVTAEIDGPVAEVNVVDSQKVKRGDILVVIDDTDTKLALRQAEADLARAQAQVASATADLERSGIDLKRREALVASGSVSGDELTQVKNGASDARAALDAAPRRRGAGPGTRRQGEGRSRPHGDPLARSTASSPAGRSSSDSASSLPRRLLSVVPVSEMYVNANFKEVQLKMVRPGQKVELVSDLYGHKVVFHGVVDGFSGGTGAAFALIPAQNATGNWIKVVQRLPVRIRLNPAELAAHPLRVGLSMDAKVDLRSNSGQFASTSAQLAATHK